MYVYTLSALFSFFFLFFSSFPFFLLFPHSYLPLSDHNQMSSYEHTGTGSFSVQPPTFHNLISGFAADLSSTPFDPAPPPLPAIPQPQPQQSVRELSNGLLPAYIKPLPLRMTVDDVSHLWKKGALTIPDTYFRDALLTAYVEYVHPYMPLIELDEFLTTVDTAAGETGRISLLLFQAVMFAGVAFVDMSHLTAAGFVTRKAARKAFYLKARVRAPQSVPTSPKYDRVI